MCRRVQTFLSKRSRLIVGNKTRVLDDMKYEQTAEEETMKAIGRYDSRLQMFVEEPHELDMAKLAFLRWMVEHGLLEHGPAGPPSGEWATRPMD